MSQDQRLAARCLEVDQGRSDARCEDSGATLRSRCRGDQKGRIDGVLEIADGFRKQGVSVGTDGGIGQLDGGGNGTS